MAVVASDLLAPNGPVDATLFPGVASNVLATQLTGYITRAAADPYVLVADSSVVDGMTRARALEYVFTTVHVRMSAEPATVNVGPDKGSHTYSTEQLKAIWRLAMQYRAEFEAFIVAAATPSSGPLPGSRSVGLTQEW